MVKLIEMDPKVTVFEQMNVEGSAVILINTFNVDPEDVDRFLNAWTADAAVMKAAARIHFDAASSRHRWKQCVRQLCRMGIDRTLQTRVRQS
jgi:hypothetical protein